MLFQHANWRFRKNLLKKEKEEFREIERLYLIATAWGHDKAASNLARMLIQKGMSEKFRSQVASEASGQMVLRGMPAGRAYSQAHMWSNILFNDDLDYYTLGRSDYDAKSVEIAEDLVQRNIPGGYYLKGVMLEAGFGVEKDAKASMQFLRKAADLGNPDAQFYLGRKLSNEIGKEMQRCAADQGHARAAFHIASDLKNGANYAEAFNYFQIAVKAGDQSAAEILRDEFNDPALSTKAYPGLTRDEERANRYEKITETLSSYKLSSSVLNYSAETRFHDIFPTVDDIDKIAPLPPANLPGWDGQIKWVKELEQSKAPSLPKEKRIKEMALAKSLDPQTGWPLNPESEKE